MKAFTFRGLLLTGLHTLMWIHLDLSVFLNVFLRNECCCLQVKSAFSSLLENLKQTFFLFQEGLKESKRSFYK